MGWGRGESSTRSGRDATLLERTENERPGPRPAMLGGERYRVAQWKDDRMEEDRAGSAERWRRGNKVWVQDGRDGCSQWQKGWGKQHQEETRGASEWQRRGGFPHDEQCGPEWRTRGKQNDIAGWNRRCRRPRNAVFSIGVGSSVSRMGMGRPGWNRRMTVRGRGQRTRGFASD